MTGKKSLSFLDSDSNILEILHTPIYTIDEFRDSEIDFQGEYLLKTLSFNLQTFHKILDKTVSVLVSMEY